MFIELFTYEFVSIFNITRWALLFKIVTYKVKFKKKFEKIFMEN